MVGKMWFRAKSEIITMLMASLIGFLFGMIICFLVVKLFPDPETTTAALASFFALCIGVAVISFGGGSRMVSNFNIAVSMGYIRKKFWIEEVAITILELLILGTVGFVFSKLDLFILTNAYRGVPLDSVFDINKIYETLLQTTNMILLICVILIARFGFFLSIQLMGTKGWFISYIIFMACTMLLVKGGKKNILQGVINTIISLSEYINGQFWQCMGIAVCVIFLVISYRLVQKLEVKGI